MCKYCKIYKNIKRDIRAYQVYLSALKQEHESSFIDENEDAQLALHAEIENVEEHIENLKRLSH